MWFTRLLAAVVTAAALSGCAREITRALAPNQPPEVRLTVEASVDDQGAVDYTMAWSAEDPDGRVDRYLVAIDPPSLAADAAGWNTTRGVRHSLRIARRSLTELAAATEHRGYHVFAVRAIDEDGAISEPATKAFFGANHAPRVSIIDPQPGPNPVAVPPSFQVRWHGEDLDGRVAQYRYRLFGPHNPDVPHVPDFILWALAYPDSFARLYQPDFEGWTTAPEATLHATFEDLEIGSRYLFAITAFDEQGAYDPVFSAQRNMVRVTIASVAPSLTLSSEFFSVTTAGGVDPGRWIHLEIPADRKVVLRLSAVPSPGTRIKAFVVQAGAKPIHLPAVDASFEIGPYETNGEVVLLLVLVVTTTGVGYPAIFRFTVVRPTFDKPMLIVDDTRFSPDQFVNGTLEPPRGPWPSAAELDTFLYAGGGVPWREYPPAPGGGTQLSTPGIFNGYDYDTVGTRGISSGTLPLSILGRYQHVIWYTDQLGATYTNSPLDLRYPTTALRRMSARLASNTLAMYVQQGGKLWLMGGGAAYATLIDWNQPGTSNDSYFSDSELVPGRFMYDWAFWRSLVRTPQTATRATLHRAGVLTPFQDPSTAPGRGWPGQPNYSSLPPNLNLRTPASDPLPPRVSSVNFYNAVFAAEVLDEVPNVILEGETSALDTLYFAARPSGMPLAPMMTLHHGAHGPPAVFSGFAVWDIRRSQAIPVVDFVLQDLWGMPRGNAPRISARSAPVAARASRHE